MTDVQPLTAEFANCWLCFKSRAECVVDQAPDPCLGFIEGVSNATCGHGQQFPYVQFADGSQINGEEAMRWFAKKGIGPFSQQAETIRELKAAKDGAYLERNQVVAALAKCFPSGVAKTAIEGWSEDWHGCVYIDLPTGQVSWHFHDSQAYLFADLPAYTGKWDGHDTPEKYRRVAALTSTEAAAVEGEQEDDHFGFGCCGGYVDGVTNERMHRAECRS